MLIPSNSEKISNIPEDNQVPPLNNSHYSFTPSQSVEFQIQSIVTIIALPQATETFSSSFADGYS